MNWFVIMAEGIREDGSYINPKYYGPFHTWGNAWDWLVSKTHTPLIGTSPASEIRQLEKP